MGSRDNLKSEKAKDRYDRNFNSVETTYLQKEFEEHDKEIRNKAIDEFAGRLKAEFPMVEDEYGATTNLILNKKLDEIVNQLAEEYNNDFCEWHKVKNGNAYKCNTHAEIHDSRVLDWCVCPYCGKKIKAVE